MNGISKTTMTQSDFICSHEFFYPRRCDFTIKSAWIMSNYSFGILNPLTLLKTSQKVSEILHESTEKQHVLILWMLTHGLMIGVNISISHVRLYGVSIPFKHSNVIRLISEIACNSFFIFTFEEFYAKSSAVHKSDIKLCYVNKSGKNNFFMVRARVDIHGYTTY